MTYSTLFLRARGCLAAALLALAGLQAQAQPMEVSVETELRANPALDARVLSRLSRGTAAEQLASQGGWVRVKVRNQEGWVRLTHVKPVNAAPSLALGANPLTGPGGIFSASSNTPTSTTGTRGLRQEELANAQPAPAEVRQLERNAVTNAQAAQHAQNGKVVAQKFDNYEGEQK